MKFRIWIISAMMLCLAVNAAGQDALRDYRFVWDTNPYIQLSNPAAVSLWDGRMAIAEAGFSKANGELRDISFSPDSWEVTAGTEAYCRITDLIAFHGVLEWQDFAGKDMGGPIMMDPGYNPVGFFESTEETLGTKKRELYNLGGEIALSPSRRWGLGLGINYQAGDQTKVKDPRFSNIWMDLDIDAGVTFRASDAFVLGASVGWRNTLEQVRGHVYGLTDKQYYIYTDKGGFFGTMAELAGDNNEMPESTARPMNNDWYTASLQAVIGGKFSNEVTFAKRSGYYGKRSSTTPVFFEYDGIKAGYKGLLLIPVRNNLHRIAISARYETLGNDENTIQYSAEPGGNVIVKYPVDPQHIFDRKILSAALDYRLCFNTEGGRPAHTLGVRGGWESMSSTTVIFPFWRKQAISQIDAEVSWQENISLGSKTVLTLDAAGNAHFGYGNKKEDGTYATTTSTNLMSFDSYLDKHYEFETATRAGAAFGITYTRAFKDSLAVWVKASDSFTSLLKAPEFIAGKTRNIFTISLGCNF